MQTSITTTGRSKLSSLEGLRGILALTVCAGHLGLNTAAARLGLQVRFDLAVDVFFAISGFVLTRAYYLERRTFRDLAVSRIARLYPLHLATMLWCLLLSFSGAVDANLLLQNLLLVQNIGLPPNRWAFNFPSWSISVEMAVSLAFYFVMRRDRPGLAAALLAGGVALCAFETASGFTPALNHAGVFNSGLMRGIAGFAIGAAAYLVTLHRGDACARLRQRAGPAALAATGVLAAFFLVETWWWAIGLGFACAVFAAVLLAAIADEVPMLSSRPFVWLGTVSYSVYLLHIPVYWSASALFGRHVLGSGKFVLLAAVLAASAASYRWFEVPMQRLLLKRLARPRPVASAR